MSGKHTPGPWRVSTIGRRNDGSIAVMSERGPVAYANLLEPTKRGMAHNSKDGESQSNANVIAAAPELLAACKSALEQMAATVAPSHAFTDAVDALDAAIAKAEGR